MTLSTSIRSPLGDELKPQRLFRAIRSMARSWLYYKRRDHVVDPLTDIRTWEHKADRYHVNWAIHIPDRYRDEFLSKLRGWIEKAVGYLDRSDCKVTNIFNVNGLMRYMLKGTHQPDAKRFGIRHDPQGEVWGRRAGAATCLGRAARAKDYFDGRVTR